MANKIQFKRGLKSQLPTLNVAEPAFTTDTKELFIGDGVSNTQLAKQDDLMSHLAESASEAHGAIRKEYLLFDGVLTSGSATVTLPVNFTSLSEFDDLIVGIKSVTNYGNVRLIGKNGDFLSHHASVIAGGMPTMRWINLSVVNNSITIHYNRKSNADGTGFENASTDLWVSYMVGVKYD